MKIDEEEVMLNRELLKVLGVDTRIRILKALRKRQKTQSELALELSLSTSTVLEHLGQLENVALVQKLEEGRKWKYYKLTKNAEKLLLRDGVHAVVLLAASLFVMLSIGILLFLVQGAQPSAQQQEMQTLGGIRVEIGNELNVAKAPVALPEELDNLNETNQTKNETKAGIK